jgi:predicted phosphoribosyltransferase
VTLGIAIEAPLEGGVTPGDRFGGKRGEEALDMKQRLSELYARPRFVDRVQAGRRLAGSLDAYRGKDVLVLGIPRGGVPVAAEVAKHLNAELDIVVARKLGAPGSPELAIGAVTANGGLFLNEDLLDELQVSEEYLNAVVASERAEARRRQERLRGARPRAPIAGRIVIVGDDGLAPGATMRAALRSVRKDHPSLLIAALPVGSREGCDELRSEADEVVCVSQPEPFFAVGLHYWHFSPTEDEEVQRLLAESYERRLAAEEVPR